MMCPVQSICGGCPVLHLSRADELDGKRKWVVDAFAEHDIHTEIERPISVGSRAGYRNRLRMKVKHGLAEFFNPAKAQGCVVLRPELWDAIQYLQTVTKEKPDLLAGVDHVEVRVADEVGVVGLLLVDRSGFRDHGQIGVLSRELGRGWRVQMWGHPEQPRLVYEISDDRTLQVPIDSFVQVNSAVNRRLISEVGAEVNRVGARSFIDLYSGAGNLAFPLLVAGLSGVVVERNGSAMAALVDQAGEFDMRALVGDVSSWVESLEVADAVLCNPARSGIASQHERIARLTRKVLVYVGCNPTTLARDVALFVSHGLEVKSIRTFDMFPGTRHVETVVTMRPASPG